MQVFTHMVTLDQTQAAMEQLIVPGKQPSIKVAFWNAALSKRNSLERNCKQAQVMRSYANRPLPSNQDVLRTELGGLMSSTLHTLYQIEQLANSGLIHFNTGDTFELQSKWRDSMCALIDGMGCKTVSFALHIYNPAVCKLVTIDCWHLRRLGWDKKNESPTRAQYLELEQAILQDMQALYEDEGQGKQYWQVTLAACLWERTRQAYGKSDTKDGTYQDHSGLTCYV